MINARTTSVSKKLNALSFLLTDVVRALIMFYMIPVWTTIFEIYFLKKRPGLERVLTLSLALGGLWVVFSQSNIIPLPQNAFCGNGMILD